MKTFLFCYAAAHCDSLLNRAVYKYNYLLTYLLIHFKAFSYAEPAVFFPGSSLKTVASANCANQGGVARPSGLDQQRLDH